MICVLAEIEVNEGRRDDFLTVFRQLVPKVLAEDGCIQYEPMIDVATSIARQPAVRENVVTVVEKWESIEALETHLVAPHMNEFRKSIEGLVAGITLQIIEPA